MVVGGRADTEDVVRCVAEHGVEGEEDCLGELGHLLGPHVTDPLMNLVVASPGAGTIWRLLP